MPTMNFQYTDAEPAIPDERLLPIVDEVRNAHRPWLDEAEFATARVKNPNGVTEIWFIGRTLWQKEPERSLGMVQTKFMRTTASQWERSEEERSRFVGKPDPVKAFFHLIGKTLADEVVSMRQLITDDIDRARNFGLPN